MDADFKNIDFDDTKNHKSGTLPDTDNLTTPVYLRNTFRFDCPSGENASAAARDVCGRHSTFVSTAQLIVLLMNMKNFVKLLTSRTVLCSLLKSFEFKAGKHVVK